MDNAADRKSVRKKEKAARQAEVRRQQVVREIMSTRDGREWVWQKLAEAGIFATCSITDALQLAMFTGHRNAGILLLNEVIAFSPDNFILAMREHNERDADNRSVSDDSGAGEEGSTDDPDSSNGYDPKGHAEAYI